MPPLTELKSQSLLKPGDNGGPKSNCGTLLLFVVILSPLGAIGIPVRLSQDWVFNGLLGSKELKNFSPSVAVGTPLLATTWPALKVIWGLMISSVEKWFSSLSLLLILIRTSSLDSSGIGVAAADGGSMISVLLLAPSCLGILGLQMHFSESEHLQFLSPC